MEEKAALYSARVTSLITMILVFSRDKYLEQILRVWIPNFWPKVEPRGGHTFTIFRYEEQPLNSSNPHKGFSKLVKLLLLYTQKIVFVSQAAILQFFFVFFN